MKIERNKLFEALSYINQINDSNLLNMDFSDLFDDKIDLSQQDKEKLMNFSIQQSNIEIIRNMFLNRTNYGK